MPMSPEHTMISQEVERRATLVRMDTLLRDLGTAEADADRNARFVSGFDWAVRAGESLRGGVSTPLVRERVSQDWAQQRPRQIAIPRLVSEFSCAAWRS